MMHLRELREKFQSRIKDVMEYRDFLNFIENSFHVPVSSLTSVIIDLCPDRAAVECEILELQTNDTLKALNAEHKADVYHFWNLIPDIDYPSLKQCVQKVMSFFVSTYTCESTFSTMKIVKRKQRNKLTNAHLDCLTRIAVTNYKYSMRRVK